MSKTEKIVSTIALVLLLVLIAELVIYNHFDKKVCVDRTGQLYKLEQKLQEQRKVTSGVVVQYENLKNKVNSEHFYANLKKKHNEKLDYITTLSANEQVKFLSEWLSEEDSLRR